LIDLFDNKVQSGVEMIDDTMNDDELYDNEVVIYFGRIKMEGCIG